jgi:hypothetical protein
VTNRRVRRNCSMKSSSAWRGFTVLQSRSWSKEREASQRFVVAVSCHWHGSEGEDSRRGCARPIEVLELGANGTMVPHCRSVRLGNPAVPTAHPFDPDAKFKHALV